MRTRALLSAVALLAGGTGLAACGSDSPSGSSSSTGGNTVKIAYQRFGDSRVMDDWLTQVKSQWEGANPGKKVELQPIVASENDYYTKLALMLRSPSTSPDLVYEDTFLVNSDIKAGYLRPLDPYLDEWDQWGQYVDNAKLAAKGLDGKTYGIPLGTDTRGLWYNKEILQKAGIAVPWQPKSWDDVLTAARAVKQKVPGVTPLNIYASKASGEATSMQGFEMLLYGTGGSLYDESSKKWVVGNKHFTDSLNFVKTVFGEKLGPDVKDATDANLGNNVSEKFLPGGKLAIALDGSWLAGTWASTGSKPWPEWSSVIGQAAMPTQNGQAPGAVSMSGGWTYAISAKAPNPDLAWSFLQTAQNPANATAYTVKAAQIAVRKDVAATPEYQKANAQTPVFSEVVKATKYRPAYAEYPRISNAIQVAMEAVMTGQASPEEAAKTYDEAVKQVVGPENTVQMP